VIALYQMVKVASISWVEAARSAAVSEGSEPFHCHYIMQCNLERVKAVYNRPAEQQTIANMMFPRNLLRAGAAAGKALAAACEKRERIRVASGMRDPVARSISLIIFFRDFYGHISRPLNPKVTLSADYVIAALQENWRWVLECREPEQTFEWLLWYMTGAFRTWFAEEMSSAFGVDVLEDAFPVAEGTQKINTSSAEIFFYRMEDMFPEAPAYRALLAEASAFLETPLDLFPSVNTSWTRRSREISAEVRRRFWLPSDMLDAIYSEPAVRHFYTDDEIAAFRKRWLKREADAPA
jgi:hypothetical protein